MSENKVAPLRTSTHNHMEAQTPPANMIVRAWHWYEDTLSGWNAKLARATGHLGAFTARRPVTVLLLSLLVVGLCSAGWARFRQENDSDKLWVPRSSKGKTDREWVNQNYGSSKDGVQFLATLQDKWKGVDAGFGGNNVIQLATTWEIFTLDAAIRALVAYDDGRAYRFEDICYIDTITGTCQNSGYLNYWNMTFQTYLTSVGGSATNCLQGNRAALTRDINQREYADNTATNPLSVFAPLVLDPQTLQITSAEVIAVGYDIDASVPDSMADAWYKVYLDLLKSASSTLDLQYIHLDYISGNSVGDEIGRSVSKDVKLIAISVIVFFVVAILGISRFDWVNTRSSLAIVGVGGAALAVVAGYGFTLLIGQPFTTLQMVLPYILLGVTVDVMFILVKGLDEIVAKEPHLDIEERFFKLMAGPGLSCAVVLLASAVAFALGATSILPATTWFSVYATMGTLAILFVQLTLFIAVFVLNERRIAARRRDCCCCSIATAAQPAMHVSLPGTPTAAAGQAPQQQTVDLPAATQADASPNPAGSSNFFKVAFERYYGPFLMLWPVRILVLLVFTGLCIACGLAIPHLERGQPISDLAPKDSYLIPYDKLSSNTFGYQSGGPINLYFRGIDVTQPAEQGKMLSVLSETLQNKYINATLSSFQGNWLIEFITWVNTTQPSAITPEGGCINPYIGATSGLLAQFTDPQPLPGCVSAASFSSLMNQWLLIPENKKKASSFVFAPVPAGSPAPFGTITANRVAVIQAASMGEGTFDGKSIKSERYTERDINRGIFAPENEGRRKDDQVFLMYSPGFIFSEGDASLSYMAEEYAIVALCGVGAVMLFMLVNPIAAVLMMIAVGMVNLFLYGEMWALGIRFNQVSVINMVMATGLAVDYSVYWAQKFMTTTADATRAGRVKVALAETGSAVFLGGVTALLGSVPLAFSSSTILVTFFKLLWGTIIFALIIGLILVPVVFSIIGPPPLRRLAAALDEVYSSKGDVEMSMEARCNAADASKAAHDSGKQHSASSGTASSVLGEGDKKAALASIV